MKNILLLVTFGLVSLGTAQQAPAFTFTTNKTVCVLHFLHTAAGGEHTSQSYKAFIDEQLGADTAFTKLVERFDALDFSSGYRKPELPRKRYRRRTVGDFIWIHAAQSSSLTDFSQRTIGLLTVADQAELLEVLAKAQPFYEGLVWQPQLNNIVRTERLLKSYEDRVGNLFGQVARFYGTPWPVNIPFTVALCPIPLASGVSSAVPKVNTLLCSYLSENAEEYKATLGVAVHEMCHSVYDEQPPPLQNQIDDWFMLSKSPYAPYAYAFFNESLATAIGNGWAYEQLNGRMDGNQWYADPVFDGFARALFPLVKSYLREHQVLDRAFVETAIEAFAKTFPESNRDINVLLRQVGLYLDGTDEQKMQRYSDAILNRFRVGSSFMRAPLTTGETLRTLQYPQLTKLIVIDEEREQRWQVLGKHYDELAATVVPHEANSAYTFFDEATRSPVLILLVDSVQGLHNLLEILGQQRVLVFGQNIALGGPHEP